MTKNIIIVLVIVGAGFLIWFFNNKKQESQGSGGQAGFSTTPEIQGTLGAVMDYPGGLKVQDLVVGTGAEAKDGATLSVHYVGTLENGTKFDSSLDRGQPFSFLLGAGEVIKGWDQGVKGMKVGGRRKLIIPPSLGYGTTGAGNMIPPNATLIFEVELLAVN